MSTKKRVAQVGLGGRHEMFRDAVAGKYADYYQMVAMCDTNPGRLNASREVLKTKYGVEVPGYPADRFDAMVAEAKPDCILVTSADWTHDEYICRGMELGCDIICEKPMTIDIERCRRILETQKRTGKSLRVTFNYRYSPPRTQIKDLLMSGVIGEVLSLDFHWMLDTSHGADYYRRWHRNKRNSGGLLVHKATHHFDLINWWLSSVPEKVSAFGHRQFYTPQTGDRYGLTKRGERCYGCAESNRCPFHLNLNDADKGGSLKKLYLDCEKHDGYFRDRCVFSPDIDIEDSMSASVTYRNGVKLSYSLNSFSPWEGHMVSFNGTKGRIEHKCEETVYINGDGTVPGALKKEGTWTKIYPHWAGAYEVDVWSAEGGHGGGDATLLDDLFNPNAAADKYKRAADQRAGAYSILTGIAANISMAENRIVSIDEMKLPLEEPDYPPMPGRDEPLPGREES